MSRVRNIAKRLLRNGWSDEFTSLKLREQYRTRGIDIGLYSYGCFDPKRVPPGVTVGRYCSFAPSAQIFLRNHGLQFIGLTAYLYNEKLGVVDRDMMPSASLVIGDDVWVGHNATIAPGVETIGRGAAIAAGAIVTRPVPPYAIMGGNPAKLIRMRFAPEIIAAIEATRWWERDLAGLRDLVRENPDLVFRPAEHLERRD